MSENKYCGSCKNFTNEDVNGYGWCSRFLTRTRCGSGICRGYEMPNNGWTELTPDNVDEINADLIVVTDGIYYKMANDWHASLSTLAEVGVYYFYVLPELKIERNEQADTN